MDAHLRISKLPLKRAALLLLARGCSFSPQSVLVVPPTENSFGGDPTLRRFAGAPTGGAFPCSSSKWRRQANGQFVRASSSPIFLFRGRNTENSERDVLRPDVISFGVEPPSQTFTGGLPPLESRRRPGECRGLDGSAGRGPRRKYFRWGNLGGTRRRGGHNTSMLEDDNSFLSRGRKARMGLPAKCMHFVGSPGWRGKSNSHARCTVYSKRLRTR